MSIHGNVNIREVRALLKDHGWTQVSVKGHYERWAKDKDTVQLTVHSDEVDPRCVGELRKKFDWWPLGWGGGDVNEARKK